MKKISSIIILLVGLTAFASAQEFTLYGEGFMPTGRFAKNTQVIDAYGDYYPVCAITEGNNFLGGGGPGWGVGFQVASSMGGIKGMDWLVDCGYRNGRLNDELIQYFDDYANTYGDPNITKAPRYHNIPLMIGPRATFKLADGLDIFASLQLGANIRIISDATYTTATFADYESTCTLGFRVAAGLLFFDHLRLEANWSWLGDDLVEATWFNGGAPQYGAYGNLETMHAALRLGWTF